MSREGMFESLAEMLDYGQLVTDPVELLTYDVDASNDRGAPDGLVLPRSAEEVLKVVQWAAQRNLPLVARGAGTGLSGGAVAERGGLVLSFSHMNRILEFDITGRRALVEPGLVNLHLDTHAKEAGLYYPPDPASGRTATLGGNLAENAGGPHCFKYGVTTNYITRLDVVLADGRLARLGGEALDYPEYDFLGLLAGSEGTLGIVTAIGVRLLRCPPAVKTLMVAFNSVGSAGEAVSAIIAAGLVPATMEFMDQRMMRIIEDYAHPGLPVEAEAALIIEVDGFPQSLSPQMDEIIEILHQYGAWDLRVAESEEERERIWFGRKSAAGAMARLSPAYYLLDGTVPRSKLAKTLSKINQICDSLELRVAYVFHAGDGNLHPFILIEDPSDRALLELVHQAGRQVMEICVAENGSITGEHGVGIEKRKYMPLMYSREELGAMLDIKDVFDPGNIMNPGKIFPQEETSDRELGGKGEEQSLDDFTAILEPRSTQEALSMIRACTSGGNSIRLRGGGTKSGLLEGAQCVISSQGLSGIREYALEDLYVTVGAGTTLGDLQSELGKDGMWFPAASPWPNATVGGILATNFNSPVRMRYGALRDLLLAVTAVLPDGRLIRVGRPVVKNVAGYDLPKLFVGAYGTLGLVCDVTIKLAPISRAHETLVIPLEGLGRGLKLGKALLGICLAASALLLCRGREAGIESPFALVYTAEGHPLDVQAELEQVRALMHAEGIEVRLGEGDGTGVQMWTKWIAEAAPLGGEIEAALLRIGAPSRDAPDLVHSLVSGLNDLGFIADLANGLLYIQSDGDFEGTRQAASQLGGYAVLLAAPGGHPGAVDPWGYTPGSLELMRRLKAKWDPQGLFNPGAFLV